MSADNTIVISMWRGATCRELNTEREEVLAQVHPGTAVVVTRGVVQEAELRALCARAIALLDSAEQVCPGFGGREDVRLWRKRYRAYLESEVSK